jgi:hypothetical protein
VRLSEHFTAEEMRYFETPAPYRPNVLALVALLERLRATWGVPVRVTSVYRDPGHNAQLAGASSASQHMDGTAADVQPLGLDYELALDKVARDAALRQTFGQFIAYKSKSHFHIALPTRGKIGQILEQTSEDPDKPNYATVAPGERAGGVLSGAVGVGAALVAGLIAAGVILYRSDA